MRDALLRDLSPVHNSDGLVRDVVGLENFCTTIYRDMAESTPKGADDLGYPHLDDRGDEEPQSGC